MPDPTDPPSPQPLAPAPTPAAPTTAAPTTAAPTTAVPTTAALTTAALTTAALTTAAALRARLAGRAIVLAPGVADALTASIAEAAGAEAIYLTGAGIAYTRLGRPDVGLTTQTEVADQLGAVTDRVAVPVIVDADTGYGNAINVQRTVRLFERAGAAAIQIEDQGFPKRCGHLRGKRVIPAQEMLGKIAAAVDARRDDDTLIIARTDAAAVEGFEPALERAQAYAEAGADVLFFEAPRTTGQLQEVTDRLGHTAPLLANMVEGGATPVLSAPQLQALGFSLVIFPGGIVRALARTASDYYTSLQATGSTLAFADRMLDFDGLNSLLGTSDLLACGQRYSGQADD